MRATIIITQDDGKTLADLSVNIGNDAFTVPEIVETAVLFISSVTTVAADHDRKATDEAEQIIVPPDYALTLKAIEEGKTLPVVRQLRESCDMSFEQARAVTDRVQRGLFDVIVKEGLSADEAARLQSAFTEAGALTEIS